jgi:hypothetical protein
LYLALIGTRKAADLGYATNHTAHDSADRAADGANFRRTAFHLAGNSLCLGCGGRSEQTRNHGDLELLLHRQSSVFCFDWPAKRTWLREVPRRDDATIRHAPTLSIRPGTA